MSSPGPYLNWSIDSAVQINRSRLDVSLLWGLLGLSKAFAAFLLVVSPPRRIDCLADFQPTLSWRSGSEGRSVQAFDSRNNPGHFKYRFCLSAAVPVLHPSVSDRRRGTVSR